MEGYLRLWIPDSWVEYSCLQLCCRNCLYSLHSRFPSFVLLWVWVHTLGPQKSRLCMDASPHQRPGRFLDIIGRDSSVSKSRRFHVTHLSVSSSLLCSAREVFGLIQSVNILVILNLTGYMLTIFRFGFIHLRCILQIPSKRSVHFLKSWTSTDYFSNSTGSSATNRRFFSDIVTLTCIF